MRPSQRTRQGWGPRTLSLKEIEERLEGILQRNDEEALNTLRDQVRILGPHLEMQTEVKAFEEKVGALLGTRTSAMASPLRLARVPGKP